MSGFLSYDYKPAEYKPQKISKPVFTDFPGPQPKEDEVIVPTDEKKEEIVEKIIEPTAEPLEVIQEEKPIVKPTLPSKKLKINEFKQMFSEDAKRAAARLNIDPNIVLAQAFLESGGDPSKPMFGIKAQKGYKGTSKEYSTSEHLNGQDVKIKDRFRTYNTPAEAFDDYANFMLGKRYAKAIGAPTAKDYYTEIKKAGYATAPNYVDALMSVYNKFNI